MRITELHTCSYFHFHLDNLSRKLLKMSLWCNGYRGKKPSKENIYSSRRQLFYQPRKVVYYFVDKRFGYSTFRWQYACQPFLYSPLPQRSRLYARGKKAEDRQSRRARTHARPKWSWSPAELLSFNIRWILHCE